MRTLLRDYDGRIWIRPIKIPFKFDIHEYLGVKYENNLRELLRSTTKKNKVNTPPKTLFCSELVSMVYVKFGVIRPLTVMNVDPENLQSGAGDGDILKFSHESFELDFKWHILIFFLHEQNVFVG